MPTVVKGSGQHCYSISSETFSGDYEKTIFFLPKFFIEVNRREGLTIKKAFSLLKARYTIDGEALR